MEDQREYLSLSQSMYVTGHLKSRHHWIDGTITGEGIYGLILAACLDPEDPTRNVFIYSSTNMPPDGLEFIRVKTDIEILTGQNEDFLGRRTDNLNPNDALCKETVVINSGHHFEYASVFAFAVWVYSDSKPDLYQLLRRQYTDNFKSKSQFIGFVKMLQDLSWLTTSSLDTIQTFLETIPEQNAINVDDDDDDDKEKVMERLVALNILFEKAGIVVDKTDLARFSYFLFNKPIPEKIGGTNHYKILTGQRKKKGSPNEHGKLEEHVTQLLVKYHLIRPA